MMKPLMVKYAEERGGLKPVNVMDGEFDGGNKMKTRSFNRPDSEDKINKLKQYNFALQSKKKIK